MTYKYFLNSSVILFSFSIFSTLPATAQVIPDLSLPVNSKTIPQGNTIQIEGGTSSGKNLFHSFSEFSVSTGQIAAFNNDLNIQNIISRVTGRTPSTIDGILKSNGKANFFLLNSNGIIFNQNAKLEVGGSFLASTANSLKFDDGTELVTNSGNKPLLSMRTPIGLNFGGQNGDIVVRDTGHSLGSSSLSPVFGFESSQDGLKVQPGQTLGLIGSGITLDGAILTANSGNIEIGSLDVGTVNFQKSNTGYPFKYQAQSSFQNIELTNSALINASGLGQGFIQYFGKNISIDKASISIIQGLGSIPSGNIHFTATNRLTISGSREGARIPAGIFSESLSSGDGGDIQIVTPTLLLTEGGTIATGTFGKASAGDISLKISKSTKILGVSPRVARRSSAITSISGFSSSNKSGEISLTTKNLTVANGAIFGTLSFSSGDASDVRVLASDSILVTGVEPNLFTPALISSSSFREGNSGSVTIETSRLFVRQGGRVDSSTTSSGAAGKVKINASDLIEVSGSVPGSRNPSLITSSANIVDDALLEAFPILRPSGRSGDVDIKTSRLFIKNGGLISVQNEGPNDAGDITVTADQISIDNASLIATAFGNGGNIKLFTNFLFLDDGTISATTEGNGTGGNIDINTKLFVGFGGNNITANAVNDRGGNIRIDTTGLFLSPDTNITATSKADPLLDGIVIINTQRTGAEETTPPAPDLETNPQVTSACNPSTGASKFVMMGPGGLDEEPSNSVSIDSSWSASPLPLASKSQSVTSTKESSIIEANGWKMVNGKLVLISEKQAPSIPISSNPSICDRT